MLIDVWKQCKPGNGFHIPPIKRVLTGAWFFYDPHYIWFICGQNEKINQIWDVLMIYKQACGLGCCCWDCKNQTWDLGTKTLGREYMMVNWWPWLGTVSWSMGTAFTTNHAKEWRGLLSTLFIWVWMLQVFKTIHILRCWKLHQQVE